MASPEMTLIVFAICAGVNLVVLSTRTLADTFDGSAGGGTRALSAVLDARDSGAGVVEKRPLERTLRARPTLTGEQRDVVARLGTDGDGVAVLAGKPGTGKTFTLAAAREAWQAAGYPVLGVATARRAAAEFEEGAGIRSTSTFALLADLRTRGAPLPGQCVLVVDEAGMVATRDIAQLVDAVLEVDGKVVLVGDHRQLPELQAGGTFRALVQRGLALELLDNVRQLHAWERRALDRLRDGPPAEALAAPPTKTRTTSPRTRGHRAATAC